MRFSILALIALAAIPAIAVAQSPAPKFSPPTFHNGTTNRKPSSANGTSCARNGIAAQQQTINPITGQPQAQTLVSVPVTGGGGSVPNATTRRQQLEACAHAR